MLRRHCLSLVLLPALAALVIALPLQAQLLTNLQSFPDRISVGDPQVVSNDHKEGPKGEATADFNGDGKPDLAVGNLDGTVTVLMGLGGGKFSAPRHLRTGALELRAVLAADLNGDGKPDLAVASPMDGKLLLYFNDGAGNFPAATALEGWPGVRCLASGDFDGDGKMDLAAAGPGLGVRHFRGTGGGAFVVMGDLPRLSPLHSELPRPVYAMRTLRSRDGLRDDLLVTHAESAALWILSTVPASLSGEPPVNVSRLPGWQSLATPVVLNEVQVLNATTLRDADGEAQPWVELLNKSTEPVNLSGWKLKSGTAEWTFPGVTVNSGAFLTVFLSGKNRIAGPELHTSFFLKQNAGDLSLVLPNAVTAHSLTLTEHAVPDISYGLAPDVNAAKWFDIPSPGAENNAGFSDVADIPQDSRIALSITPRDPAPGQAVTVRVTMPAQFTGTSNVQNVWFSTTAGLEEVHHLMHLQSPGVYEEVLPPGVFTGTTPHRVLARLDDGTGNVFTTEVHRGLDETQISGAATPQPGRLLPVASVPSPKVKAFEVGPVLLPATQAGAPADLVYADDVCGLLRVHRAGAGRRRFDPMPVQDVPVRGAPRDVKLADTDGDGRLDATVVLRQMDLAATFKNVNGSFVASGELPTGRSPREAVMADFTGDGKPDAAVINRYSADISILPTASNLPGLVSMDQIYAVNGEVSGLTVTDYNGDGRDDVMQLLRGSGEISIRYAGPDGTLSAPVFRAVSVAPSGGEAPSGTATADVNNDGRPDLLTANLGWGGSGSISVTLAKPDGTYEAPRTFNGGGGMFAIAVADFNNDGKKDVVAGLFDCRVLFFFGDGTGNFTSSYSVPFVYESRVMVTGDFDQDGDTDIAGAGYSGKVVTLENLGAASAAGWNKVTYEPQSPSAYGTERIAVTSVNADSDPDLVIGTGNGVVIYKGAAGMAFNYAPEFNDPGPGFSVSDVLMLDLDGDGKKEMVASCRNAACINIMTLTPEGRYAVTTRADVPSGRFLGSGDLDGDGKPDLVGTGDVLWTALSSRPPHDAAPGSSDTPRTQLSEIVINEVLPQNTRVPLTVDNGKKTDFLEIYNGTAAATALTGWKVRLQSTQEGVAVDTTWTLPATTTPAKGHALVLFSIEPGTNHTGFTLPSEGGTLTLLKPDNTEADRVVYPNAQENVSWSRFQDGHPSFHADRIPSPGMSNLDNGTVPPEVKLTAPSPATMIAGMPLKFTAKGRDDAGIISLSLLWNRMDAPLSEPQRLVLYDDGMHEDGPGVDGLFAGRMATGLPAGAEVQFYLEAVDLNGETVLLPDNAQLSGPGEAPAAWSFSLTTPPALEISEVCTGNTTLLRDEIGGHPDYVKVRNKGATAVDLSRILLAKSPLSDNSAVYAFPQGQMLAAGGEFTVFADGNTAQGTLHAPFTLDAGGDDLSLLAVTPSGARQWIHSLTVPATAADSKYLALPGTSLRAAVTATASLGLNNWSGTAWDEYGNAFAVVRFATVAGNNYLIEGDAPGTPVAWTSLETVPGDGSVRTVTRPLTSMSALRAVPGALALMLRVDAAMPDNMAAAVYATTRGATAVTLYYGLTDGGTVTTAWSKVGSPFTASVSAENQFVWNLSALNVDADYFYRLRADTPGGVVWSAPGTFFRTLKADAGSVTSLTMTRLNPADAAVTLSVSPAGVVATVEILAGSVDAFGNVAAWPRRFTATPGTAPGTWTANLTGLARETIYYARVKTAAQNVSAQRLVFRTPGAVDNLRSNLFLSEIMYHPVESTLEENLAGFEEDDFEFIELYNASDESMDLSGLWFEGIDFDFPVSGGPVIAPGGYAVIAANPHAFAMRYGADIPLAGWTLHPFRNGRLSNGGEIITLHAADGTVLFTTNYFDSPWQTDGDGYSLEYRGPTTAGAFETAAGYLAGRLTGGSPGWAGLPPPDQTFAAWQPLYFTAAQLSDAAVSGLNADPDKDGLSNLAEFAAGTHPLAANPGGLLSIRDGGVINTRRTLLLTFPVNAAAKELLMDLQGTDRTTNAWQLEALDAPGPMGGTGYSNGIQTSYNYLYSTRLSADGKQILVTRAVVPFALSSWWQPPAGFVPPPSRLFRLMIRKTQ